MPPKKCDIVDMMMTLNTNEPFEPFEQSKELESKQKPKLLLKLKKNPVVEALSQDLAKQIAIIKEPNDTVGPPDVNPNKLGKVVKVDKVVKLEERCIAKRLDGKQCPRGKVIESEFCNSHKKKLPNGTINDPVPETLPLPSKRGRKRKIEFNCKINDETYIAMWEHIIEDEKYLLDKYGNVYTCDSEHPVFLGKQTLENKIELPRV
jgi:hypothetical protein